MSAPPPRSQPKDTAARQDFTPQELLAWADEAQACLDSGEVIVSDHRKADATIMALRSHAILKARVEELEANERAYEAALGQRTYNEVAAHIEELESALRKIASFNDEHGERHLTFHGSYAGFDEPASVKLARAALNREAGQ